MFGIWNEEIDTLYPDEKIPVTMGEKVYEGKDFTEFVHLEGARTIATMKTDFYDESPALTVNEYGKGKAYYQAFRDCGDFWADILRAITDEIGIYPPIDTPLPDLVTVHERNDGDTRYIFVENYSGKEITCLPLGSTWLDLESGLTCDSVSLGKFDVKILKK